MSYDGSNRSFKEIGVPDGHHTISHHRGNPESLEKLAKIDRFYSEQFAYFLNQLQSKKDPDGKSLLYNSQIVFGCGLADPDRHRHNELPIIVAGHGGGTLKTGLHTDLGPGYTDVQSLPRHAEPRWDQRKIVSGIRPESWESCRRICLN